MSRLFRLVPVVFRTLRRSPIRTGLTVAGIAMAMYLFTGVEAMRNGVRDATEAGAGDSMLVVYRENRYCPFTSRLPARIEMRSEKRCDESSKTHSQVSSEARLLLTGAVCPRLHILHYAFTNQCGRV